MLNLKTLIVDIRFLLVIIHLKPVQPDQPFYSLNQENLRIHLNKNFINLIVTSGRETYTSIQKGRTENPMEMRVNSF